MKFRAKILEPACMRQFSNIVSTLSKLSKTSVLRICHDRLYFLVSEQSNRMTMWSVLDRNEFFNSYNMRGDNDKNEIYLELPSDMMSSSLSSLKAGSSVMSMKIKLTDKASPCLTIELELATQVSHIQLCVHDIPVTVIPISDWSEFEEPPSMDYDVSIQMPNMKILRNVIDRMKKLSNKLTVHVKNSGCFSLSVNTTTAMIQTHFNNLHVQDKTSNSQEACVCVDIKRFAQFLTCETLNPTSVLCNIVSDRILHPYLEHNGFKLNYYIAAVED